MADQVTCSLPPQPRKRSWTWRVLKRLAILAVVAYLLGGIVLYFLQPLLTFPGAYVHRQDATVEQSSDYELIRLQTADGHQIAAVFGKALDATGDVRPDADGRPTILFFYGNGDCVATSMELFQQFRQLGSNVFIPEYVGYPLSTGKPSEEGCCQTADAAYAYLFGRHDVDPNKIVILGRSIGSGPAVDLASRKRVAGLITISAFTSLDDMGRKVAPIYPTWPLLRTHFDNATKIGAVRCPILMVHGVADDFVPLSMMHELAGHATVPVSFLPVERADHNNIFALRGTGLLPRIQRFVDAVANRSPDEPLRPPPAR
jgi:fermentation-respiration switch protein FrsA (DUF1100 family)